MKAIAFLSILVLMSLNLSAQSTFNTQVTNWRSYNNSNVTSKTTAHSITPANVGGGIGDSLGKYLIALYDSMALIVTSTGSLNAVLTIGNTSAIPIVITDATNTSTITTSGITNTLTSGGVFRSSLTGNLLTFENSINTAFGRLSYSGTLGNSNYTLQYEPTATGSGLQSSLVSHTTGDALTVRNSSYIGIFDKNFMGVADFVGNLSSANPTQVSASNITGTISNTNLIFADHSSLQFSDGASASQAYNIYPPVPDASSFNVYNALGIKASGNIPLVIADSNFTGLTANKTHIVNPTAGHLITAQVGIYGNVRIISGATLVITVAWTDETGVGQSFTYPSLTSTGIIAIQNITCRVRSGSQISVNASVSGGTITYDIGATITQLNDK